MVCFINKVNNTSIKVDELIGYLHNETINLPVSKNFFEIFNLGNNTEINTFIITAITSKIYLLPNNVSSEVSFIKKVNNGIKNKGNSV